MEGKTRHNDSIRACRSISKILESIALYISRNEQNISILLIVSFQKKTKNVSK